MRVTLVYELPDELEAYKQALQVKTGLTQCVKLIEYDALKELHQAITNYMLKDTHDNLMHLTKTLDKYA